MAVIVKHRETGERYVLVGTGFAAYKPTKPNWFFGNLMADTRHRARNRMKPADHGYALSNKPQQRTAPRHRR